MKRKNILWSMLFLSGILLASCNKDSETTSTSTTDEVADIIATSVSSDNSGLTDEMQTTVSFVSSTASAGLKSTSLDTLYSKDSTFARESQNGAVRSYQYTYRIQYGYIYSLNAPDTLYYLCDASGEFDGPKMGCSETRQSSWRVTGFEEASSEYQLNGTTSRSGNSQSKVRNKIQATTTSTITMNNVVCDKSTLMVKSGTLDWEISGTVNGESFSYMAQITYQGNGNAQLSMNGKIYNLNLSTGEVE